MQYLSLIFGIVFTALSLGATYPAAADPDSWHRGMGSGMMGVPEHGPGMMGGYHGGFDMGPGMMGLGAFRGLNLTDDQKSRITKVQKAARTKHWALMDQMMDGHDKLQELYDAEKQDAAAINRQHKVVEDLRRQMVDNSVEAHNQINAILTKEQREKLQESGPGYGPRMRGY